MREDLARIFPLLESASYKITSSEDVRYNCAAWAAGPSEIRRRWWPAPSPFYFCPAEPREETIEGFIKVFGRLGYAICDTSDLEPSYEKLAIYADETNVPTHMARQLPSGHWTSKLGELEDIEHQTLEQLSGSDYGRVVQFLKRKRST
jgi:hypothetical protein